MGLGIPPEYRTQLFSVLKSHTRKNKPESAVLAVDMASCLYSLVPRCNTFTDLVRLFITRFEAKHIIFCFEGNNTHPRREVLHRMRYRKRDSAVMDITRLIKTNYYSYDHLKSKSGWRNAFLDEIERRMIEACPKYSTIQFTIVGKTQIYEINSQNNVPSSIVEEPEGEIRAYNMIKFMEKPAILWTNDGDGIIMSFLNPLVTTSVRMKYGKEAKLARPYDMYISHDDKDMNAVFWLFLLFGGDYTYTFDDENNPKNVSISSFGVSKKIVWDSFDFCCLEENRVFILDEGHIIFCPEKFRLLLVRVPEIAKYFKARKKKSSTKTVHFKDLLCGIFFSIILYSLGTSRIDFTRAQIDIVGETFYDFVRTTQADKLLIPLNKNAN